MHYLLRPPLFCAALLAGVSALGQSAPAAAPAAVPPVDAKPAAAPVRAPFRPSYGKLKAGEAIPDFALLTAEGKEVKFSDFAKGKTVVLDFWATWCGPCQQAMPHYEEMSRRYAGKGVVILGVCGFDTLENYVKWIAANKDRYSFPTAFDPVGKPAAGDKEAMAKTVMFGLSKGFVTPLPTTLVINAAGKLVGSYVGYTPQAHDALASLLTLAGVELDAADKPSVVYPAETAAAPAAKPSAEAGAPVAGVTAAAAVKAGESPRPKFLEGYGKMKAGEALFDFTAEQADGTAYNFASSTKGKTVVLSFWMAGLGVPPEALAFEDAWARKYAGQGVQFVAVGAYGTREEFAKWHAANATKVSFPVVFDPAGKLVPPKPSAEMTAEEKATFKAAAKEYYEKVIPMRLAGGMMAPMPHSVVIDATGKLQGFFIHAGPETAESLGNLLLRAGIKLAPEDLPAKVYTAAETAPRPVEPRIELLKPGSPAPDFPATDANGQPVKLSDYRGHVIILDFWATWCGPCLASMPHTQEVAEHYKDQGVVVLASCTSDARAKFEAWVKSNQAKYPDIHFSHDPQEKAAGRAAHKLYGVGGIPQQFVIDREGKVAALVTGYLKGEAILDAALAKAGIKVDPALIAKGAADLKARE